nr:MAG TPA: hypothetical protein [Caudoviricetes sp.]
MPKICQYSYICFIYRFLFIISESNRYIPLCHCGNL